MARLDVTLTLRLDDEDVLRLVVYRQVLREIAKNPWSADGALARRALVHFEDEDPELLPREGA